MIVPYTRAKGRELSTTIGFEEPLERCEETTEKTWEREKEIEGYG